MTEDDLLRQIEESDPGDLSEEVIDEIRGRLRDSERVQQAVLSHLIFEQYLRGLLADPGITAEAVFAEIGIRASARRRSRRTRWLWMLAILAGLGTGVGFVLSRQKSEQSTSGRSDVASETPTRQDPAPETASALETIQGLAGPADLAGEDDEAAVEPFTAADDNDDAESEPEVLSVEKPSRPFEETIFELPGAGLEPTVKDIARRWFRTVGKKSRVQSTQRGKERVLTFQGTIRLKPEWPGSGVLRLLLRDEQNLRIHLERGDEIFSVAYASAERRWAAYRASRPVESSSPREKPPRRRPRSRPRKADLSEPVFEELLGTDDGLWHASGGGSFELREQESRILMTRGDLLLLSIPLGGTPEVVDLEGRATIRSIDLYRGESAELRRGMDWGSEKTPVRVVLRGVRDASRENDDVSLPEGAALVEWVSGPDSRVIGSWDGPAQGLCEVRLRLGKVSAGDRFEFLRADGSRIAGIDFVGMEARRSAVRARLSERPASATGARVDARRQVDALVDEEVSLRVIWGPFSASLAIGSGGGVFSQIGSVRRPGGLDPFSRVALVSSSDSTADELQVRELEVRPLATITGLASADIDIDTGPFKPEPVRSPSLGSWLAGVLEMQPANSSFDDWLSSAAVATLRSGASKALGEGLLLALAEVCVEDVNLTFPEVAQRLDEIALSGDSGDVNAARGFNEKLAKWYARAAYSVLRDPGDWSFVDVHRWLTHAPIARSGALDLLPASLVERALLDLVHRGEWDELRRLCARMRFVLGVGQGGQGPSFPGRDRILSRVAWAEGLLLRHLPEEDSADLMPLPRSQQHPLEVELSKEGYNTIAEFDSALHGQAFEDACRIITAATRDAASGLLPDTRDGDLLVSLRAAVAIAMRAEPALRRAMEEQFGERGRLRLRQAQERGDRDAVEAATVQFYGTGAAVDAHVWLGDRALSAGRLSRAVASYLEALEFVGPADRNAIEARMRLVGALEGREVGSTVNERVEFAERAYGAEEFEELVRRIREERARSAVPGLFPSEPGNNPEVSAGQYAARVSARFEMRDSSRPRGLDDPRFDWISRQVALDVHEGLAVVGERNAVSVHDMATGKRKWSQSGVGEQGAMNRWPLVAMKPLVVRDRVFSRFLKKEGPRLQCLDLESGSVRWVADGYDHVASDPLWIEDQVVAVTATLEQDYIVRLRLSFFDAQTGKVVRHHPLTRFRDAWEQQIPCRMTRHLDRLIIAAGGSVVCVGAAGNVHWLRRQPWVPPAATGHSEARAGCEPIVSDGRVFVTQPGVPAIECLHLGTGRLLWREFLPKIDRIAGLVSKALVVTTRDGVIALHPIDGELVWEREVEGLDEVHVGGVPPEILTLSTVSLEPNGRRRSISMTWLDPGSGRPIGRSSLEVGDDLYQQDLAIGPVVVEPERFAVVVGKRGDRDRSLLTLERRGGVDRGGLLEGEALGPWSRRGNSVLRQAARIVLPNWTVIEAPDQSAGGLIDDWRGRQRVLVTRARAEAPVRLARPVDFPESGKVTLRLGVGRGERDRWTLRVSCRGEVRLETVVDENTVAGGWRDLEVEITGAANSRAWIIVEQQLGQGQGGEAYWGTLELDS